MEENTISSDLIRGHIDIIILRILADGDSYGYEIIKKIYTKSEKKYELKEPSLYTSLKRLEKQKLILSYWGNESQGGRRKYYKITSAGKQTWEKAVVAWEEAAKLIDILLH